jgi:hypothetical protein
MTRLRIGILGAARIADDGIVEPARSYPAAEKVGLTDLPGVGWRNSWNLPWRRSCEHGGRVVANS